MRGKLYSQITLIDFNVRDSIAFTNNCRNTNNEFENKQIRPIQRSGTFTTRMKIVAKDDISRVGGRRNVRLITIKK